MVLVQRWLLGIGFALFTLSGWARMIYSITDWYWLNFAGVKPGPLYLAITGGVWGLAGLVALTWIVMRKAWFRLVGSAVALLFALTYWMDRLFVITAPDSGNNTAFAVLLTFFGLAYALLALQPGEDVRRLFKGKGPK
jgi:hypothetical protein